MRIPCPHCGSRGVEEFAFRHTLPPAGSDAVGALYLRDNLQELSHEYWQHVRGCRAWFVLVRNPTTGAISEVRLLGEPT